MRHLTSRFRRSGPRQEFRRKQVEWHLWDRVTAMPHERARNARLPVVLAPVIAPLALTADAARRTWVIHSGLRRRAERDSDDAFVDQHSTTLPTKAELERSVLVLRSFGGDGAMQVANRDGASGPAPTATIEEILSTAAHAAGLVGVHALHDHAVDSVPSAVNYVRISMDGWEAHVRALVEHARIIVLLATPGRRLGPSFREELAMIRESGLDARTMVVGAPGNDEHTREILAELAWPIPASVPLVAHLRRDGRLRVHPAVGPRDLTDAQRYARAVMDGLEGLFEIPIHSDGPDLVGRTLYPPPPDEHL